MQLAFRFETIEATAVGDTVRGLLFSRESEADPWHLEVAAEGREDEVTYYFRDQAPYGIGPLSWLCHRTGELPDELSIFEAAEASCE